MIINLEQATMILDLFGGEEAEVSLEYAEGHFGYGLYATFVGVEDEGSVYLGNYDEAPVE